MFREGGSHFRREFTPKAFLMPCRGSKCKHSFEKFGYSEENIERYAITMGTSILCNPTNVKKKLLAEASRSLLDYKSMDLHSRIQSTGFTSQIKDNL